MIAERLWVIGVPPGVSPVDVETLGHAYLLIPLADDDHTVSTSTIGASQFSFAAPVSTTVVEMRFATAKMMTRIRTVMARRYRTSWVAGLPASKQ